MKPFRFPTFFVGHGTPMHAFDEDSYQKMLYAFSQSFPKPKAIIVLSAHSVSSDQVIVLSSKSNRIQYDYDGFPAELYEFQYRCPGDPDLASRVIGQLRAVNIAAQSETTAPLDHGIWIPLLHLYPKADVPVVRISLPLSFTPAQILKMGHALAPFREEGVLMIASGSAVHNLKKLKWTQKNSSGLPWAIDFESWVVDRLFEKNIDALLTAEENPNFTLAHPSTEHYLPIVFAVGATLPGDEVTILNRGIEYDTLSMLCFSLNHVQKNPLH